MALLSMQRDNPLCQRAQAPPCSISAYGVAYSATSRQTNPRGAIIAWATQSL